MLCGLFAEYQKSPLLFVTEMLQAKPDAWQREALEHLAKSHRISIRAGHGVGKTTFEAWAILWFICTHYPHKVLVTANSQDQLRDTIWPEIRSWAMMMPEWIAKQFEFQSDHIWLKGTHDSFVTARTASKDNPTALQGIHSDNMLFVVDEAAGIPDIVFELGTGALSSANAKWILCGNPSENSGYFYDTHHKLRSQWSTMHVSCEDVKRAQGHIKDVIARWGRDSNAYRVRVLGEFPDNSDDVVIPLRLCELAAERDVAVTDFYPVWGLDVARFGDDRSCLAKRQGNTILEVTAWRNLDTMQLAGRIYQEFAKTLDDNREPTEQTPQEILVDVIGIGAGVVDRCRELDLPVRGVNVAEQPSALDQYDRLRDELWWKAREWLQAGACKLPKDDQLIAELTTPRYRVSSLGKTQIEPKSSPTADRNKHAGWGMKNRLGYSPDLADAVILTFAGGLNRREREAFDRYKVRAKRRPVGRTWMSA